MWSDVSNLRLAIACHEFNRPELLAPADDRQVSSSGQLLP
jgi:hypothetical protein